MMTLIIILNGTISIFILLSRFTKPISAIIVGNVPSKYPTINPTAPTKLPTIKSTVSPSTLRPSRLPTRPTIRPSQLPTTLHPTSPTIEPTIHPTAPTLAPTIKPTAAPSSCPLGYYLVESTEDAISCTACPFNTYGKINTCVHCPTGYVTGSIASTGKESCINPATNFVLGILSLILCMVIAWFYIINGRLQLIAVERRVWIIDRSVIAYGSLKKVISRTKNYCRQISDVLDRQTLKDEKEILDTGNYTREYFKLRAKTILRPILFAFTVLVVFGIVLTGTIVLATTRVLFNAVLLYRGYKYYLKRDFVLLNRTHLFLQELGLGSNINRISYPIAYIINWLSIITVDLESSFGIDCVGSQAPVYLLVDFIITAVVVLNISNNINIFWFTMVTECTSEFGKLLTNRFYLRKGVCNSLSTVTYVLTGFFLRIFPSPMKINQYLLSFVYLSVFFTNNGVSSSSKNCDNAAGFPLDSVEAVLTTLLVIFLIMPMVYMFGQVLYPMPYTEKVHPVDSDNNDSDEADQRMNRDDHESTKEEQSQEQEQEQEAGIDYEQWWRYLNAWTAFDWFFVKSLVVFARNLERNMQAFLESTYTYLKDFPTPTLSTKRMTKELEIALHPEELQPKTESSRSLARISWLYVKDQQRDEFQDQMKDETKKITQFHSKHPTFMWTQVRIWEELCDQTEHIPTCLTSPSEQKVYNIMCFAVFPVQLNYSERSQDIWQFVAKSYVGFCCMSVGFWTDEMVYDLSIIDSFKEFHRKAVGNATGERERPVNDNRDLSFKYNPLRTRDDDATEVFLSGETTTNNVNDLEGGDIDSEEDIEKKALFVRYLSAMTSCRSVLWQLIPGMTAFAILSVDLSSCPVFIFSKEIDEKHLLPQLLVTNSWSIAEKQIEDGVVGKGNKKPYYWQLALLSFYVVMQESRLIQFSVVVVNNLTAFAIVFGSSNLSAFVILFLVVNLLVGFAQFGYAVLLLHQFFFSKSSDDGNEENKEDDSITQPLMAAEN